MFATNSIDCYNRIKPKLEKQKITCSEFTEIQYGLQFSIHQNKTRGLIRIFEGKKGLRIDLSQIGDDALKQSVETLLEMPLSDSEKKSRTQKTKIASTPISSGSIQQKLILEPHDTIGLDESGKGDYFGPLVTAGVLVKPEHNTLLKELGVQDSKKIPDSKIASLAKQIQGICPHAMVIIGNESYNEFYEKTGNLNVMLAWAHARVLENILKQSPCNNAILDQFASPYLVEKALMEKGKQITLIQKPKAEQHLCVAAASILARNEYVKRMSQLERKFATPLAKGASNKVIALAKEFVLKHGENELKKISKLHFKTTSEVLKNTLF